MKKRVVAALLGVLSLIGLGVPSWSENQPLSFGVIIWRSPTLTAQFWNPILRYVSDKSGVPLQLKVANTGPEHTAMVRRGEYHFLYSNHNFIKENEESGYRVFARSKDDIGTGEIVVLKDSRSEEHTSELQSHVNLVCRLLLEKKKKYKHHTNKN